MRIYRYILGLGRIMIIAFMILLFIAVASEARGDTSSAEYYSLYAYYFLVTGVILIAIGSMRKDAS